MKKILVMLSVLLLTGGCITASSEEKNTLSVSATGSVKGVPDNAVVSFSVVTQDAEAQQALADNAERMNRVVEALKALGIGEKEIRTSRVSLYPEYEPIKSGVIREGPREIIGYKATNTVAVTILKIDEAGEVIDEGVEAGANEVQSFYFKFSEDKSKELYQGALKKAVEEAGQKADVISDAMEVEIVGTHKITESGLVSPIRTMAFAVEEVMAAPTPVSPGELEVSASVSIEYEIR